MSADQNQSERPIENVGSPEPMWTLEDVARYLNCSTKTVRALVRREGLPCARLQSRLRFEASDVLRWMRQRKGM